MLILESLIVNGIESDDKSMVRDWEGVQGTPFVIIKVGQERSKRKELRCLYLHRMNKRIFLTNPM